MAPLAKATGKPLGQGPKVNQGANPNGPKSKNNRRKRVKKLKNEKETKPQVPHEVKKVIPPKTKLPMVDPSVPGTMRKAKVPMALPAVSGPESKDYMKKTAGQLNSENEIKPQGPQEVEKVIPPKTKLPMVELSVPGTTEKTIVPMAHPDVSGTMKRTIEPMAHPAVSLTAKGTQPGKDTTWAIILWTKLFRGNRAAETVVFLPEGGFCYPPLKGEYPDEKVVVEGKLSN